MCDLIPYNLAYVPNAQGISNAGNSCYFNSLIQCLLSCPSIYQVLKTTKYDNRFAQVLLSLYENALASKDIFEIVKTLWSMIINISNSKNNKYPMRLYQQGDSHEGLLMFMTAFETIPEVHRLFVHRYLNIIFCDNCKKNVVEKREDNLVFEVQANLKNMQIEKFKSIDEYYNVEMNLEDFLRKQNGYVADFICPECKNKCEKFRSTTLVMIPEILPVVIKKYEEKVVTNFPAKLVFLAKGGTKKYHYDLVAQSEHSGSMSGGHYWAIVKRADGWFVTDDSSVRMSNYGPTTNSYLIFYHFVGIFDV
jgi:ubiquitin C-terminal hydrolase